MSIIQGNSKTSAAGYTIDQSIRFDRSTSSALYRTQGTPDGTSWTLSFWMKRGQLRNGSGEEWFINGGAAYPDYIRFESNDTIRFRIFSRGIDNTTTAVFRDPGAWYHFVANWNGSTGAYNLWQNNVSLISGTGASGETYYNKSGQLFNIGRDGGGSNYFDGYFAEIVKLDNTVADPTSFGKYNGDGVWVPINVSGLTFGSEGFYIKGQDSSNLGDDSSGNTNDFTSSGLTSADQMLDTPTANLPTFNPLSKGSGTLSDGNLQYVGVGSWTNVRLNLLLPETGKWAVRFKTVTSYQQIMVGACAPDSATTYGDLDVNGVAMIRYNTFDGNFVTRVGGSRIEDTGPPTVAAQTWFQLLFDMDTGQMGVAADGATSGTFADISTYPIMDLHGASLSTARQIYALVYSGTGASGAGAILDAGQSGWTPAVTGFSALTLANLSAPTIADGSAYFQTTLYSGNGSTQEINQSGNSVFQPSWVWIKERNGTRVHSVYDEVRGVQKYLQTSAVDAESTSSLSLTSFDADGFTLGSGPWVNNSGNTYVAWQWLAGNGTASNTDGSITSTVSVNTTAGFSVVSYTGNGTAGATVGHGLGVKPSWLVCKNRQGTEQWIVYQADQGATKYGLLNSTAAFASSSGAWNNTEPTSSVVTLGGGGFGTNVSSNNMIMYAFAEIDGFSKFGTYTGNGSTDGPFVWCDFRPAFVLIKNISSATNWKIFDSAREPSNLVGAYLEPNTTAAEANLGGGNTTDLDFLSNGFKLRGGASTINNTGSSHIFMAFAEHPFGGNGVAPVPAR